MQWFLVPFLVMNPFRNLTEAIDVSLPENYPYIHKLGYNFREFLAHGPQGSNLLV